MYGDAGGAASIAVPALRRPRLVLPAAVLVLTRQREGRRFFPGAGVDGRRGCRRQWDRILFFFSGGSGASPRRYVRGCRRGTRIQGLHFWFLILNFSVCVCVFLLFSVPSSENLAISEFFLLGI